MADVPLTPTLSTQAGVAATPTAMAAADNYIVRNNGRVLLHFVKTGANPATITVISTKTEGALAVEDQTFVVPATTGDVWAGPFNPGTFNDPSGDMDVATDEDTSITIEAVQI